MEDSTSYVAIEAIALVVDDEAPANQSVHNNSGCVCRFDCFCFAITLVAVWSGFYLMISPVLLSTYTPEFDFNTSVLSVGTTQISATAAMLGTHELTGTAPQHERADDVCAAYFEESKSFLALPYQPAIKPCQEWTCLGPRNLSCPLWLSGMSDLGTECYICSAGATAQTCWQEVEWLCSQTPGSGVTTTTVAPYQKSNHAHINSRGAKADDVVTPCGTDCEVCLSNRAECAAWKSMVCGKSLEPRGMAVCFDVFLKNVVIGAVFAVAALANRLTLVADIVTHPCLFGAACALDGTRWLVLLCVATYANIVIMADITQCAESFKHNCGNVAHVMAFWFWFGISNALALTLLLMTDMTRRLYTCVEDMLNGRAWLGQLGGQQIADVPHRLRCVLLTGVSYWIAYIWSANTYCPY